jgi:hypothetical protein
MKKNSPICGRTGCSWACTTRKWVLNTACYVLAATTAKASEKDQPKTFISCSAVVRHTKNTKLQLSARKSRIHHTTCTIAQLKLSSFSEKSLINDFQISSDPGPTPNLNLGAGRQHPFDQLHSRGPQNLLHFPLADDAPSTSSSYLCLARWRMKQAGEEKKMAKVEASDWGL